MAKIQIITAMTIDGFLPEADNRFMQWVKTNPDGFPHWHECALFEIHAGYPMLDLIAERQNKAYKSDVLLAEISDKETVELLRGLSLYRLTDEMVVYILPYISGSGIPVFNDLTPSQWQVHKTKTFSNGVCRIIYQKVC